MKREGYNHAKLKLVARDLRIPLCFVRGILESIWHETAAHFPAGDIGRYTNEELAIAIDYEDDADELVAVLVKRRLLDEVPASQGRLYVHDWHEHCDDTTRQKLRNRQQTFANGLPPYGTSKNSRSPRITAEETPSTENHREEQKTPDPKPEALARSLSQKPEARNTLLAVQAPDESETRDAAERERAEAERLEKKRAEAEAKKAAELELGAQWASFLEEYPPRVGDRGLQPGRQKFEAILRNRRATFAQLLEGVQRYRRWCDHEGQTNTKFVKQIPTWLNQGCWGEDWTIIPRPNAGSSSSPTGRNRLSRVEAEAIVAEAGLLEVA